MGGFALSAGYNFNRGVHVIRSIDVNVYRAGTNAQGRPVVGFHRPDLLQDNVYGSWANSVYHALLLQLEKRFSKSFTISAHHTWSKAIDENTDFNSAFEPHLQWDAAAERALSSFHRGHRFVLRTIGTLPWKAGRGKGFRDNLIGDLTLSGIVTKRSYAPFNLNAGYDNVGDRHTNTHRPWGVGRNVGIGPDFFTVDMRVKRRFSLVEGQDPGCRRRRLQHVPPHESEEGQRDRGQAHPGGTPVLLRGAPGTGDSTFLVHFEIPGAAVSGFSPDQLLIPGPRSRVRCLLFGIAPTTRCPGSKPVVGTLKIGAPSIVN